MSKLEANREVRKILLAGYEHYSRQEERDVFEGLLLNIKSYAESEIFKEDSYLLAMQPQRHIKNKLICMVAIVCRTAADLGADDRRCYALSDHYIMKIEDTQSAHEVEALGVEIVRHYAALVDEGRQQNYSLPVGRAVRYLQQHLYEKVTVADIAAAVGVHPNYLSSRFKKEVGVPLHGYICNKKMEEAVRLLQDSNHSVSEIAEILGYSSVSHFARIFRQVYGHNPSALYKQSKQ